MSFSLRRSGSHGRGLGLVAAGAGLALTFVVALQNAAGDVPSYPECTRQATAQEQAAAKGAHTAAKGFYEKEDFERAIRSWRDAYDFDCNAHPILINIGNAYEKKGDLPSAILTFETYLRRAGYDTEIAERIHNMKDKLAPKPTATASASAPPPPPPTASAAAPPPDGPRPFGFAPLGLAIGGGVLAVVGAILVPVGISDIDAANAQCSQDANGVRVCPTQELQDQGVRGNALGLTGGIALGLGAAGLAGGLVWHFAFNKPKPAQPQKAFIAPTLGPSSVGVFGRF